MMTPSKFDSCHISLWATRQFSDFHFSNFQMWRLSIIRGTLVNFSMTAPFSRGHEPSFICFSPVLHVFILHISNLNSSTWAAQCLQSFDSVSSAKLGLVSDMKTWIRENKEAKDKQKVSSNNENYSMKTFHLEAAAIKNSQDWREYFLYSCQFHVRLWRTI